MQEITSGTVKIVIDKMPFNALTGVGSAVGDLVSARRKDNIEDYIGDLNSAFEKIDTEKKGVISFDQWKSSNLKQFFNDGNITDAQFQMYFMRIDQNSDDLISCEELSQFLLNEDSKDVIRTTKDCPTNVIKTFQGSFDTKAPKHREICTDCIISRKSRELITVSSDSIHFWCLDDLEHRRKITEPGNFVACVCFEDQSIIVAITSTRKLLFYDLGRLSQFPIELNASPSRHQIKNMSKEEATNALNVIVDDKLPLYNTPTCICKYVTDSREMYFFVGDDNGNIESFHVTAPGKRQMTDFNVVRVSRDNLHRKGVTRIVKVGEDLYASSSYDGTIAIWQWSPFTQSCKVTFKIVDKNPITNFTYNTKQQMFITCSTSRELTVWSRIGKKAFKLGGHTQFVVFASEFTSSLNEDFIVSMSNKKEFILWDALSYKLSTIWVDVTMQRPENRFGTAIFDPERKFLYAISSVPTLWKDDRKISQIHSTALTVPSFIVEVLYAPIFNQIICVDVSENITVWNLSDGSIMASHLNKTNSGGDICAACLDQTSRRLFLANISGGVEVWNYNTASMTSTADFQTEGQRIGLIQVANVCGQNVYFTTTLASQITTFNEYEKGKFDVSRKYIAMKGEMTGFVTTPTGFVTVTDNGTIYLWQLDKREPIATEVVPTESCEAVVAIGAHIIVSDNEGNLYIYGIPKLKLETTISNAHTIYVQYSIIEIIASDDHQNVYTADTLGYVKKWKVEHDPVINIVPECFVRCANKGISTILLVDENRFLLTCSSDMCVRVWSTENEMKYVGHFHEEGDKWDLEDDSSWVGESPFQVDSNHMTNPRKLDIGKSLKSIRTMRLSKFRFSKKSIDNNEVYTAFGEGATIGNEEEEFDEEEAQHQEEEDKEIEITDIDAVTKAFSDYFDYPQEDMSQYLTKYQDHANTTRTEIPKTKYNFELPGKPKELITEFEMLYDRPKSLLSLDHMVIKNDEKRRSALSSRIIDSHSYASRVVKPSFKPNPFMISLSPKRKVSSSFN